MNVIIDYDGNEIITNEKCSICLDELKDNTHELDECKHTFHSKCLISYLRTGNRSCPLCRGVTDEINQFINYGSTNSISAVIKYAKKKNANKEKNL